MLFGNVSFWSWRAGLCHALRIEHNAHNAAAAMDFIVEPLEFLLENVWLFSFRSRHDKPHCTRRDRIKPFAADGAAKGCRKRTVTIGKNQ
jgi:hypothetical protein